jgi:Tfp pilus assembly protein PilW
MEFKTISSTRAKSPRAATLRACGAFTVLEFLFAMVLGGGIITVIVALSIYTGIDFACLANYADMESSAMNAMELVTREIRSANGVTALHTNSITLSTDTGVPVTYSYSSGTRTLTRLQGGVSTVILRECDALQILAYQRTPIKGSFDQYSASTDTNQVKALFVTWTCSRAIMGKKLTSDSASAGKVVMRVN